MGRQAELLQSIARARGLVNYPLGRVGDPDDDAAWYPFGDRFDVTRAQQALSFQHHSWPDMLVEIRKNVGWQYYPTRLVAPAARVALKRRAAYRHAPGRYADVWGAIRAPFGEPIETDSATG